MERMRNAKIEQFQNSVKEEAIEIVSELPDSLTDSYRCLFLLERNKDGGSNKEERRIFNFAVVTNKEELTKKLTEFLWLRLLHDEKELRVYLSVNKRNPHKATRNILDTLLDGLYADGLNRGLIERKVIKGSRSYIMNPNTKASSFFLLDVDNEPGKDIMGDTLNEMHRLGVKEIYRKATRNGWHVVVEAFNLTLWQGVAEIKKDALILLK